MKLTGLTATAAICCSAQQVAASASAHVYTYHPHQALQKTDPDSALSPLEARLVLAQRAGVEDYHEADLRRDGVLQAVNTHGLRTPLFETSPMKRAFVFSSRETAIPQHRLHPAFAISPAPSNEQSRHLFLDLATQSLPEYLWDHSIEDRMSETMGCGEIPPEANTLFCIPTSDSELDRFVEALIATESWSITALSSNGDDNVEVQSSYGTYEMPNAQSGLHKRHHSKRALPQKEAPLEVETSSSAPIVHSTVPISAFADSSNSSTVRGILPACFPSKSTCESLTSSCAGHGECTLSYTNKAAMSQSPFKECYACSCSATVTTDSEGRKKTTYWGGPACQKKDISVEFWLFAFFGVAMLGLIGFAVGEIWGMGDQELPSVIGAGVSGPVKR